MTEWFFHKLYPDTSLASLSDKQQHLIKTMILAKIAAYVISMISFILFIYFLHSWIYLGIAIFVSAGFLFDVKVLRQKIQEIINQ